MRKENPLPTENIKDHYTIALCSDIHCGDSRFDGAMLTSAIDEINALAPDLLVVAGDLTAEGYREQFEEAAWYLDRAKCKHRIVLAGNHDCRHVGYVHFEDIFGPRHKSARSDFNVMCQGVLQDSIKVVAVDSNKPDLNDGEVGREHYGWVEREFPDDNDFKVFALHHHLISVPGTGRERNIVWDAGDVLDTISKVGVDMVLCGHKHVPFVWTVNQMIIVNSGTVGTHRTRGYAKPAYNVIEIHPDSIIVETKVPGGASEERVVFPRLRRVGGGE